MNERIKELRKALKLSQDAFGRRIGISGASVSRLESGENEPSAQTVAFICREFSVSETWLRYGTGEMYRKNDGEVARLVERYQFEDFVEKLLTAYSALPLDYQKAVLEYARRIAADIMEDVRRDAEIDAQVEAYRRKLIAEKNAAPASSSSEETA